MSDPRYPIGQFDHTGPVTEEHLGRWLDQIEALPARMRAAVEGLAEPQLDTPYREGGWTLRQVVHHVPDSHVNAYIRFKWALTEDVPRIKAYREERWAELADYRDVPPATSLDFLAVVHAKWLGLLRRLSSADLARSFVHPESGINRLDRTIGMYAWHGRHHLAHITTTVERHGWKENR